MLKIKWDCRTRPGKKISKKVFKRIRKDQQDDIEYYNGALSLVKSENSRKFKVLLKLVICKVNLFVVSKLQSKILLLQNCLH